MVNFVVFCGWGCPLAEVDWCLLVGVSAARFEGGDVLEGSWWQV